MKRSHQTLLLLASLIAIVVTVRAQTPQENVPVPQEGVQPVSTARNKVAESGLRPNGPGPVLLSSLPGVVYQLGPDGAATFYSLVTPFRGVAISQDGHNLYIGN